ncbi:GNAT family N-acetyltransferase [Streptomyces sp. NPDC006476]|uniref:GNAT family N-acetyltransferase n=1 Tax=Streptomyces sp. NPDC006476 TaxID=3157175 RepID=UPI0033BF71C2
MTAPLIRAPQDAADWRSYEDLASRCFNEPEIDTRPIRDHCVARVADTSIGIVAGAMALRCDAYFGGAAIPAAGVACVAVAPEARRRGTAARLITEIVDELRNEGRAIALLWTPAAGVYRRWGWEVAGLGRRWILPLAAFADMPRPRQIERGIGPRGVEFQDRQAEAWNGALKRPSWWWSWKYPKNDPGRFLYHLLGADGHVVGLVGYEHRRNGAWGYDLLVTDMWAADPQAAREVYGFLAGHGSQAHRVIFDQAAVPSPPPFLWELPHHHASEDAWYPWMIRLLDVPAALAQRSWPTPLAGTLEFTVEHAEAPPTVITVQVDGGKAQTEPGGAGTICIPETALAAWYCGALSLTQLRQTLPGVAPSTLELMIALTSGAGPWLPDVF